jgi:hypothetical protein
MTCQARLTTTAPKGIWIWKKSSRAKLCSLIPTIKGTKPKPYCLTDGPSGHSIKSKMHHESMNLPLLLSPSYTLGWGYLFFSFSRTSVHAPFLPVPFPPMASGWRAGAAAAQRWPASARLEGAWLRATSRAQGGATGCRGESAGSDPGSGPQVVPSRRGRRGRRSSCERVRGGGGRRPRWWIGRRSRTPNRIWGYGASAST